MRIDAETWSRVTTLFDRLVDLAPETRAEELARIRVEADVADWLNRLLEAHDQPGELLIDRTLQGVVDGLAETADTDLFPGSGERLGPWRLVEELGRGGMGSVLRGERADGRYEQTVAIKLLQPSAYGQIDREAMDNEIRLLARLEHPGIVRLIEGGITPDGLPYLVMEHVSGEPIDQWCSRHDATLQTRIALVRQAAAALAHAHRRLVIHADIKPSNVLVSDDGRVRLVDFGIAGRLQERAEAHLPSMLRCSPAWCAPEQLHGSPPDVAQDVFGLGALLLRLLTGNRIRTGDRITRLMTGSPIEDRPVAPPSSQALAGLPVGEIRGSLDAVCSTALAVDPGARFSSVEALDAELERWQRHEPVRAARLGRPARLALWFRRNRVPAVAGALAALAMIAGTATALWQAEQARTAADRAQLQAGRAETIKEFLLSMFKTADPWLAGGSELDIRDVLVRGARQAETDQTLDAATRVEVLTTLGDVKIALGWHDEARQMFDKAEVELDEHPDLPDELRGRLWLERAVLDGQVDDHRGREDALDRALALLPPADQAVGRTLHARLWSQYASLFATENRYDDALAAFERLEQLLDAPGEPLPDLRRNLLSARAILASNRGDLDEAYAAMQAERELQIRTGNARHSTMIRTLSNLAAVAAQLGRLDEALAHDRQAAELAREVYPPNHPSAARAFYALGDTLRQRGRYDEALALLDEARAIQVEAMIDAERALTDMVRARTMLALGRGAEAAEVAASARRTLEPLWGETARAIIQALDFELLGHALAGNPVALERAASIARLRLDALESPARWQPLAQMLRWRLARIRFDAADRSAARALLEEAGRAPDDVARHPSIMLRLLGLKALVDGLDGNDIHERIMTELEDPAANDDSRAYALCALITAQAAQGDLPTATLRQQLDAVARSATLSHEGRADAACPSAARSASG